MELDGDLMLSQEGGPQWLQSVHEISMEFISCRSHHQWYF